MVFLLFNVIPFVVLLAITPCSVILVFILGLEHTSYFITAYLQVILYHFANNIESLQEHALSSLGKCLLKSFAHFYLFYFIFK